jgi:hypothetical protein
MNEVIEGNQTSSIFKASNIVTDVVIEGRGFGQIRVEEKPTDGNWRLKDNRVGAFCIRTPDPTIEYRIRAIGVNKPIRVFMGP